MGSEWKDMEVDGATKRSMPFRIYDGSMQGKKSPVVLYFGGGSFLDKDRNEESPIARVFANSGALVIEADYAQPSENVFPKALEFAFAALRCLSSKRKQYGGRRSLLLVAGEEAGGNVAAGVALKARDQMPNEIDGQILLSPLIDPLMATASFREAEATGMRDRWTEGWSHYLGSGGGYCHPYAAPGHCSRLSGVAPALILTSQDDPLRDEAADYAARLVAAGVEVTSRVLPACQGWTQIYDAGAMAGCVPPDALRAEFEGFIEGLENRTSCF
ncbi:alpha/beta hydrolase fold domain-containing protein [Pararhizobium capsulatum]|nr:alpha/beta hydrolase [Pararhizobium capsulatum]